MTNALASVSDDLMGIVGFLLFCAYGVYLIFLIQGIRAFTRYMIYHPLPRPGCRRVEDAAASSERPADGPPRAQA